MLGGIGLSACGSNDDGAASTGSDPATRGPTADPLSPEIKLGLIDSGFKDRRCRGRTGRLSRTSHRAMGNTAECEIRRGNGSPMGSNTSIDQANAVGMHHDGMWFYPLGDAGDDGLLVMNHEYIDQSALHPERPNDR